MNSYYHPRKIQFIFESDSLDKAFSYLSDSAKISNRFLFVSDNNYLAETLELKTNQINPNQINPKQISPSQVNQYLGQELDFLYYDAIQTFDVNQFAAIIGCLIGGGTLVLHLPEYFKSIITSFSTTHDSFEYINILNHKNKSQLLFRFVRLIINKQVTKSNLTEQAIGFEQDNTKNHDAFHLEQESLIKKIERCALGHAKRPLVITADRGRGKSTALARASANLCLINKKDIIITAPRKANLIIFFQQFKLSIKELVENNFSQPSKKSNIQIKEAIGRVEFIPIDKLGQEITHGKILIIDEAGSFPVQVLSKVIKKFNRIIFSSTITGYEGNGRGFELKFFPILKKTFPQYRRENLSIPYRWRTDDLIEYCCNKSFLLGLSTKTLNHKTEIISQSADVTFKFIEKNALIRNEKLLSEVFSLLTEAHYQTRPSDLERMLTDDCLKVYIGHNAKGKIISTCLIVKEGNLETNQCEDISKGKLRLKGQLLPQSLISTQGLVSSGELSYWRIMRIAVLASEQNQSVGSDMIKFVIQQAKNNNIDLIGTSFALSNSLFNFWNLLKFSCFRIALKTDSSTGLIPADFLQPISNKGDLCFKSAIKRFNQSFIYSSSASYKSLDPELLCNVFISQVVEQLKKLNIVQTSELKEDIKNYVDRARSFEMVEWQVFKLLQHYLANPAKNKYANNNLKIMFSKIIQKYSWKEVSLNFNLSGKAEARELVRSNIEHICNITYEN